MMKINNNKELWSEWIGDHIEDSKETETMSQQLVRKWVFKGTECGCVFGTMLTTDPSADPEGIYVGGYAEGSDAELPLYTLKWGFTINAFMEALDYADADGVEAWHEANEDDWSEAYASLDMITEEEWKDGTI